MARAALYGQIYLSLANKEIDLDSDTIKVMLVDSTYAFGQDTHRYKSDVTGEISGPGYTAGGSTLGSKTVTYDAGTNTVKFDAADTSWTGASFTAAGAVVYDDTPATAATKPLLGFVDFDADLVATDGTFTIEWAAAGVLTLNAGALA